MSDTVDILVVGGGINGTGIARDAAGRGLSVILCEKDDLSQHTSSASTKLIHGGLRYLEHYEFKLVRDSLVEREVLLRAAPHIIWPMRFVLPYHKGLRPAWLLRMGLFLYDHIGGRKMLPPTRKVTFADSHHKHVLDSNYKFGYEYSDCWVEDSRLVALNAVDAAKRGADIRTRTCCIALERQKDLWRALLQDHQGNKTWVSARSVVNAAGPWVAKVLNLSDSATSQSGVRLVKGSHIVTRKLFEGDGAYILQHADDRIVFAIPYEQDYTLIGTTDLAFDGDTQNVEISPEELSYLCELVSQYFEKPVTQDDVVWSYSGVRPLFDDHEDNASVVTRDYVLEIDAPEEKAPILSVFGGKITTFRKLSEQAVTKLENHVSAMSSGAWTKGAPLPGGDIINADFERFLDEQLSKYSWAPKPFIRRLCRAYGTRIDQVLADANATSDLGLWFGESLCEREARYLIDHEFACAPEDILWRRSKLGLHMSDEERSSFIEWFDTIIGSNLAMSDDEKELPPESETVPETMSALS